MRSTSQPKPTLPPSPAVHAQLSKPAPGESPCFPTATDVDQREDTEPIQEAPNLYEDPYPAPPNSSKEEIPATHYNLREYSKEMFDAYNAPKVHGEALWLTYITFFRPHTIRSWNHAVVHMWTEILIERGVYVRTGIRVSNCNALIAIMSRTQHILTSYQPLNVSDSTHPH